MKLYTRLWILMIVVAVAVITDQWSKRWAQTQLTQSFVSQEYEEKEGEKIPVMVTRYYPVRETVIIPNLFHFAYRENPAAAFSITRSLPDWFRRPFLLLMSTLAMLLLLGWYFRIQNPPVWFLGVLALIMGGALGNWIDRASLGYVIDFLHVYAGIFGRPDLIWPTFNLADSYIVVGAVGLGIYSFLYPNG